MKKSAVVFILLFGLCPIALVGCAGLYGKLFVEPGETVDIISASVSQITYEYTHHYDSELPYVSRAAEVQCKRFGKHAVLSNIVRKNPDRSLATFRCE